MKHIQAEYVEEFSQSRNQNRRKRAERSFVIQGKTLIAFHVLRPFKQQTKL